MITLHIPNPESVASSDAAHEAVSATAVAAEEVTQSAVNHGNGSVAHQIIDQFLIELAGDEDATFKQISSNLRQTVFSGKPTELELKVAIFGV